MDTMQNEHGIVYEHLNKMVSYRIGYFGWYGISPLTLLGFFIASVVFVFVVRLVDKNEDDVNHVLCVRIRLLPFSLFAFKIHLTSSTHNPNVEPRSYTERYGVF